METFLVLPGLKLHVNCCAFAFLMVCDMNSTCGFIDLSVIPLLELRRHDPGSRCGVHCHGPSPTGGIGRHSAAEKGTPYILRPFLGALSHDGVQSFLSKGLPGQVGFRNTFSVSTAAES